MAKDNGAGVAATEGLSGAKSGGKEQSGVGWSELSWLFYAKLAVVCWLC